MKIRVVLIALVLSSLTFLTGCVSVPNAPEIIKDNNAVDLPVEIKVNEQIVSEKKAEKILDKISKQSGSDDLLEKHIKVEQEITDTPLIAGNDARLLFDGEQTFNAMYDAISSAQDHINLEYFIFENIKLKDTDLKTILLNKVIQGVQVCVVYDAFGSSSTPPELFDELRKGGVKITEFHPLDITDVRKLNLRDHRKILVVDGATAIVGGVNLSSTYQSKSNLGMHLNETKNTNNAYWKDTDMIIKGPAVSELQKLFVSHWDKKQPIDQSTFFPKIDNKGSEFLRVIGSAPTEGSPLYYATLVSALENAEKEITLSSAYFVPTKTQKEALINAAERNVEVNLFLPGVSDSSIAMLVQHSHYEDLLEKGINIYESEDEVLHSKTVTVDGVWSVVGSSNFDIRSASTNQEVDVVVLGKETASELKNKFSSDIVKAKKIDLQTFRSRPLIQKIKEKFYRIFQNYL